MDNPGKPAIFRIDSVGRGLSRNVTKEFREKQKIGGHDVC